MKLKLLLCLLFSTQILLAMKSHKKTEDIELEGFVEILPIEEIKCSNDPILNVGMFKNFLTYISWEQSGKQYALFCKQYDLVSRKIVVRYDIPSNNFCTLTEKGKTLLFHKHVCEKKCESIRVTNLIKGLTTRYPNKKVFISKNGNTFSSDCDTDELSFNNRSLKLKDDLNLYTCAFSKSDYLFAYTNINSKWIYVVPTVKLFIYESDKAKTLELGQFLLIDFPDEKIQTLSFYNENFLYILTQNNIFKAYIKSYSKECKIKYSHVYKSKEPDEFKSFKILSDKKILILLRDSSPYVCLYDVETFREISKIHTEKKVLSIAISEDETKLICGTDDGYILIYDIDPIK